jgi:hypothetical protein
LAPKFGLLLGVTMGLAKVLLKVPTRVVLEPSPQRPHALFGHVDFCMVRVFSISSHIPTDQTNHLVVAPTPVTDRMPHEKVVAKDLVTIQIRTSVQKLSDVCRKLGRDTFVGVHDKDPGVRGLRNSPVFEVSRVNVLPPNNPTPTQLVHNVQRAVRRTRIGDE